jgi:Carboxypeptidase regulatory-like domain
MSVICGLFVSSTTIAADSGSEMEGVKILMERGDRSRALTGRYNRLAALTSTCSIQNKIFAGTGDDPFAPASTLCLNGSLALTDPTFNRPLASSTGTGIGNGTAGNCSLSGSATAAHYDVYSFNLTGCAAFPTAVTASLCGPAGCAAPAAIDSVLVLYRNVPAGDPLTANGGLPAVFDPANACTNARAENDDTGGTPSATGGSTCNQVNTADCLAACTVSTALSQFRRTLGNGRFTLVVTGFGNTTAGNYNLYVDAPGAGCQLALAPSAGGANLSGRVRTADGTGISNVVITISGGQLASPISTRSSSFGYYSFSDLPAGESYVVSAASKRFTFSNPTQVINLLGTQDNVDFVSDAP